MKVYNTLTRKVQKLKTIKRGAVGMYTCGPTVYDYAHIGNFRAYIFEDLLRRHLKYSGLNVVQVMNLTDVDDKTIRGARAKGISLQQYTKEYKQAFFEDLKTLRIEPAEHYPAATEHIAEMIALIQTLLDKGYAYKSDDNSIYFSIEKFKDYGKLAHIDLSGLRAGARVCQDEYEKENMGDFALWKAWDEEDGEIFWESPWGKGRPGWHIECSAMSMKYLGETFDIHTGGVDNMFPHHEDEIAQSEAASGKPFVNYWLHCEHLIVDGKKMSKSLGNFYALRDLRKQGFSGREIRYVLMSAHYRQQLNFTFDSLRAARAALERLDEFQEKVATFEKSGSNGQNPSWVRKAVKEFRRALDNDLNLPDALRAVFGMVHEGNKMFEKGSTEGAAAAGRAMRDFDRVLGFLEPEKDVIDDAALALAEKREAARKECDWKAADALRDEIFSMGWQVQDTPQGPKLKRPSK